MGGLHCRDGREDIATIVKGSGEWIAMTIRRARTGRPAEVACTLGIMGGMPCVLGTRVPEPYQPVTAATDRQPRVA